MKKLFVFFIVILFFQSCDELNKGTIRLSNNSTDPYSIFIDGNYQATLNANTYSEYRLLEGVHKVQVKQNSGYLLYPTEKEYSVRIESMKSVEYVFP